MCGRCDSAFDFVEVDDFEPILTAGIIFRPMGCAKGGSQGESADPAHSIDTDFHFFISVVARVLVASFIKQIDFKIMTVL
jgi:hypothetical protein